MAEFITLLRLSISHDYFADNACTALSVSLTSDSQRLFRRRGLFFRQNSLSEWSVVCEKNIFGFSAGDELAFEFRFRDGNFCYYTEMSFYDAKKVYTLFPNQGETYVADSLQEENLARKDDLFFTCRVSLTDAILNMAKEGEDNLFKLCFKAKSLYWSYLFLLKNEPKKTSLLKLVELDEKLTFTDVEPFSVSWNDCKYTMVTRSLHTVPLREKYDYNLSLKEVMNGNSSHSRVLMKYMEHPIPGRYVSNLFKKDAIVVIVSI